jgi:A/G-specific adenine glycosylase
MCPVQQDCHGHAKGIEATLPVRVDKGERPVRLGLAFLALREDGHVLLRRRPDAGLLGGMLEVPSTAWADLLPPVKEALRTAPVRADWWQVPGTVAHTFTHFRLELIVFRAVVPPETSLTFWADASRCRWTPRRALDREALPSVMRKVVAHALREM